MKTSAILLAVAVFLTSSSTQAAPAAAAAAAEPSTPIAGYETFITSWEVEIRPGGPMAILNGTVEEVHAQLPELNPNWGQDYVIETVQDETGFVSTEKRTDFSDSKYSCGAFLLARMTVIPKGIEYLRGVKGQPRNGAGPGNS